MSSRVLIQPLGLQAASASSGLDHGSKRKHEKCNHLGLFSRPDFWAKNRETTRRHFTVHVSWLSRGSLPKSWACKAHRVPGKVFSSFPFLAAFVRPRVGPGSCSNSRPCFLPCRRRGKTVMVPKVQNNACARTAVITEWMLQRRPQAAPLDAYAMRQSAGAPTRPQKSESTPPTATAPTPWRPRPSAPLLPKCATQRAALEMV